MNNKNDKKAIELTDDIEPMLAWIVIIYWKSNFISNTKCHPA